jgi:predicted alpha/beta hydrolase family esterase
MTGRWRISTIAVLAAAMLTLGANSSMAAPRAHVYLLRGLMNIFSLGMDTLAEELDRRGVYATVHNHTEYAGLAESAAAAYKAGKEGPIIIIGHSLGADAAMEMAAYLGKKGVPVALVVPFDGTQSLSAPPNVARVLNLTQRDYAFMRAGPGFHGSLVNVDVRNDPSIDHLNIDKSPRLHARVIGEVLSVVGGGHRMASPGGSQPGPAKSSAPAGEEGSGAKAAPAGEHAPAAPTTSAPGAPAKSGDGASNAPSMMPLADSGRGVPVIAVPERRPGRASSDAAAAQKPAAAPSQPAAPGQLPD